MIASLSLTSRPRELRLGVHGVVVWGLLLSFFAPFALAQSGAVEVPAVEVTATVDVDNEDEREPGEESGGDEEREEAELLENTKRGLPPLKRLQLLGGDASSAIIGGSKVIVDRPKPDEERQLSSYLIRFIGKKATPENLAHVERWLLKLERYRAAVCRYTGRGKARIVRCGITRAPTIRSVTLEGLPWTLLEADVRRRVFLRPGEVLDDKDDKGRTRITRQEERLVRYLERKGLYGAKVRVLSPPISRSSDVDIIIRISFGEFVVVRSVNATMSLPFSRERVVDEFLHMCWGDGLLEGFEALTIRCFTKDRIRAVSERLEKELRDLGYPEARITVKSSFVGITPPEDRMRRQKTTKSTTSAKENRKPTSTRALLLQAKLSLGNNAAKQKDGMRTKAKNAFATSAAPPLPVGKACEPVPPRRKGQPKTPRCVDLTVEVNAGRHLVPTIRIRGDARENPYTTDPFAALTPTFQGFRDLSAAIGGIARATLVAPSRIVQLATGRPLTTSLDTSIDTEALHAALSFNEARSADAIEAHVSAQQLRFALQRLGYFFSGVSFEVEEFSDRVEVNFEIDPGDPVSVARIDFHGNETHTIEEILSVVDLASKVRAAGTEGFVTQLDLEEDRRRLLSFYEALGFAEANVEVNAERVGLHHVVVHFRISEGAQWHVDDIQLEGIPNELVGAVLQTIEHCRGGRASKARRAPLHALDCQGAPFRPSDADALALDQKRVLNVFVSEGFPYATASISPVDFSADGGVVLKISVDPLGAISDEHRAKIERQQRRERQRRSKDAIANAASANSPDDFVNMPNVMSDDALGRVHLGEVFIDGANISVREVMLRELAISNRVLRPRQIAEGVSRLRRTGLYSRVELDFLGIDEQVDRVHLLIQVEERPTITVDTSVGFSTDRLFGWRLEARDRNFYGSMFDVSGVLDFGLFIGRYTNAQGQVRWPRVLGSRVDVRFTPSFVYEDRPSIDIPRIPTESKAQLAVGVWSVDQFRRRQARIGQVLGVEFQPFEKSDILTLSIDLEQRLEWTDNLAKPLPVFSLEALQTVDGLTLAFQQCVLPVSTITPKVTLGELDNPFDPKRGYRLEGSAMLGHPIIGVSCQAGTLNPIDNLEVIGEWVGLLSASATGYYTFGRVTFAGNIRGWTGVARSDDRFFQSSLIRNQSLLAVGGDRSVRGFNQDDIGLKSYGTRPDEGIAVYDDNNLLSLSGGVMNLELRTTLLKNFFIGDLNGAVFVDVGMVTDTVNLPWFSPRQFWEELSAPQDAYVDPRLGVGVGVGLRYVLPVGPISADVAIRPDPLIDAAFGLTPRNVAFDVHFQLGYVF